MRHATILECGNVETKLLSKHDGRAHKLANEPNSPHIFYSFGEDGLVQHVSHDLRVLAKHLLRIFLFLFYNLNLSKITLFFQFDLRTGEPTQLFTCQPVRAFSYMSVVHLNDLAIDPRNPNLFVVGGSDEFYRLYDIRKYKYNASADFCEPADYFCPKHLLGDENVGITGLAFSEHSELLVSYAEEFIYCFSKDMGWGSDVSTILADHLTDDSDVEMETDSKLGPQLFKGHRNCVTVKGILFFFFFHMRPKTSSWRHRMLSPRDMALQLPARQNQQTNPVRVVSNGLEFILTFDGLVCQWYPRLCETKWLWVQVMLRTCEIDLWCKCCEIVKFAVLKKILTFDANSSGEDDSEE